MINTYIISGFLGAGKTTFIQHLLQSQKLGKVMLLENEFGEVGVDASFFDQSLAIKEINNGCICCSLQGDFETALKEIEKYEIDSLIIEPSGVGKLHDVMSVLLKNDHYRLVSHLCVVNVNTCKKYHKNFKEFFDDQVISANAILLSHLDATTPEKKEEALEILRMLNDEAEISEKPFEEYRDEELMDMIIKNVCDCPECVEFMEEEECCCCCHEHHHDHDHHEHHHDHDHEHHHHHDHDHEHHHHHHHHGDEVFEAISFSPERTYTKEELETILAHVEEAIIRVKGYVKGEGTMWYFNYILNEYHIFEGEPKEKALVVVIGSDFDHHRAQEMFR